MADLRPLLPWKPMIELPESGRADETPLPSLEGTMPPWATATMALNFAPSLYIFR
jgi:hypothetical protein